LEILKKFRRLLFYINLKKKKKAKKATVESGAISSFYIAFQYIYNSFFIAAELNFYKLFLLVDLNQKAFRLSTVV